MSGDLVGIVDCNEILWGEAVAVGPYSKVYKAKYKNEDIAVKLFGRTAGFDSTRFGEEIAILLQLRHAHIIRAIGACLPNSAHPAILLMELGEANPATATLNATQMAVVMIQTLSAIDYIHYRGLLHLDLKPTNILLDKDLNAKVADLGGIKFADLSLTENNLGTASYQPPECVDGSVATPARDIYSLSLIFGELLQGKRVYEPSTPRVELLGKINDMTSRVAPERASPDLGRLLEQMWQPDASRRPGARECLEALNDSVVFGADAATVRKVKATLLGAQDVEKGCEAHKRGDDAEAFRLCMRAAENGSGRAMSNLGCCFQNGQGVQQNFEEAAKWFRRGADAGYAYAMLGIGGLLRDGKGCDVDLVEAVNWFRKEAELGCAECMCCMGVAYQKGRGVVQDLVEGVEWFRKAAEAGEVVAEMNLGICYDRGRGVAKNAVEAFRWFIAAAEGGCVVSMGEVAMHYEAGDGVELDTTKAAEWRQRAAK
jgi:TPR repeat protein